MFKNKTAWFSDSVNKDVRRFWASQGGIISDWKTADYLFSNDAVCPDTQRIHCSDEYVRDRATVFHSAYLDTCRLRRSTKSVPLGHYLLPPLSVQKEVKAVIGRFIWEQKELLGNVTQQETRGTEQVSNIQPGGSHPRTEEPIRQNIMMTSAPRDPSACCEVQLYPVNNMISGFVHIDQLKKFTGELQDFLPSHSGSSIRCSYKTLSEQEQ